ncbi:MAG: glycosyltransferase family 2 protein [Microgenomates group bacterium]
MENNKVFASIIVLNYQGEKIIKQTIDSLLEVKYPRGKFEIIIADNHSLDNSTEIIKSYGNGVKYLPFSQNFGFAKGNNLAIKSTHGKYIILLNNDCIVERNWLSELIKLADTNPKIFSVGSKIKQYPPSKNTIQNAGSIVFHDGYTKDIGAIINQDHQQSYEQDSGQYDEPSSVYSTCGAAVLYRRSIMKKIGLLDENFFMYYEDLEICERARLCGYQNMYCPTAVAYHNHAQSSKEWSPFFIYHTEKGRLLHIFYHFPLKVFLTQFVIFTAKSKLRFIRSILIRKNTLRSWQYLKVIFYFIFSFPKISRKRKLFSRLYTSDKRSKNYHQILSGYWYLKKNAYQVI